jgi:hypothetical protein
MSSASLVSRGALGVRPTSVRRRGTHSRFAVVTAAAKDTAKDAKQRASSPKTKTTHTKTTQTGVAVPTSPSPVPAAPVVFGGGFGLILALGLLRAFARNKNKGSLASLEERGALDENRDVDEAKFYKGMMKTVRTVRVPELSESQIVAARERRRQSMLNDSNESVGASDNLKNTQLPKNHPFATSESIDAEESRTQFEKIRENNKPRGRQRGTPPK